MSVHYIIQKKNHQQMHKEFFINCNTLLHVSTLLGHLQGEFCYHYTKVALYTWVRMCCWLCTASFLEAWTCRPGPQRVHASSTQSIAHSHSTTKCNLSVMITKNSPWRWPSRVETWRSVLQLMKKLFVHLLVISVFSKLYVISVTYHRISRISNTHFYSYSHKQVD
jgi:hypothetical protein